MYNKSDTKLEFNERSHSPLRIGQHVIYEGDCGKILKSLPAKSIDVVITSPPYNINLKYDSYQDNLDDESYLDWMYGICERIKIALRDDGSFFLNISGSSSYPWLPFELAARLKKLFVMQNHIVWVKSISNYDDSVGHFKPVTSYRYVNHNHEHIFHFTKNGDVRIDRLSIGVPFKDKTNINRWGHDRDVRCRGNTWYIPYKTVTNKSQKYNHPGTFPVELPIWCTWLHGKSSPVVLDPFVGTGTTLVASHLCGGMGIGIDTDPSYIRTAAIRLREVCKDSMHITLTKAELSELLKQDPSTKSDGGFQSFFVSLQSKVNKTTGDIVLSGDDIEKIPRYAFDYKNGGWERRLQAVFSSHLGVKLGR